MIHTRIVFRGYSATPDLSSIGGCPRIPRAYQLRVLPYSPPVASQVAGQYPLNLVRPDSGGEVLTIPDGAVLRFVRPPPDGWALAPAITPSGLPDAWLIQWTDDPADHLEPVEPIRRTSVIYDSGAVAGGGAIFSPVLDTTQFEILCVLAKNYDPTLARNFGFNAYDFDGTTLLASGFILGAVAANGQAFSTMMPGTYTTNAWAFNALPFPRLSLFLSSGGGASAGRIIAYGR